MVPCSLGNKAAFLTKIAQNMQLNPKPQSGSVIHKESVIVDILDDKENEVLYHNVANLLACRKCVCYQDISFRIFSHLMNQSHAHMF
jgi:hypothetical protein